MRLAQRSAIPSFYFALLSHHYIFFPLYLYICITNSIQYFPTQPGSEIGLSILHFILLSHQFNIFLFSLFFFLIVTYTLQIQHFPMQPSTGIGPSIFPFSNSHFFLPTFSGHVACFPSCFFPLLVPRCVWMCVWTCACVSVYVLVHFHVMCLCVCVLFFFFFFFLHLIHFTLHHIFHICFYVLAPV